MSRRLPASLGSVLFHQQNLLTKSQQLKAFQLIFQNIYNGACVTDAKGFVTHFNEPYGRFLGVDPIEQIGKHITDVVENTRMHIVAKTGKAETNASQSIGGKSMLVQRIPIKENGQVIAVFGQVTFKNIKEVGLLAAKLADLESRVKIYQKELNSLRSTKYSFDSIIGETMLLLQLKKEALQASSTNLSVLVSGESGTGKELFAQSIHNASSRKSQPFIRLNCAAIPRDLLEAELFGYDKGAFTGAKSTGKPGKFELADTGTLFLDEIGDLPLEMQPKLLRVLEEKEFERVGGNRVIHSDFRLIAASNQDLEGMVARGEFRADLYYRLSVVPLHIPPLRERVGDISLLANHILQQIISESMQPLIEFSQAAETLLKQQTWPGNVRELNNVIERTVAILESDQITPADLPSYLLRGKYKRVNVDNPLLKDAVANTEKKVIMNALKTTAYNKVRAAELLGIHRTLLYKKIARYNISLLPD